MAEESCGQGWVLSVRWAIRSLKPGGTFLQEKVAQLPLTRFDVSAYSTQFSASVRDFDISAYLAPKDARKMDVFVQYGMAAGIQAFEDSGYEVTEGNAAR